MNIPNARKWLLLLALMFIACIAAIQVQAFSMPIASPTTAAPAIDITALADRTKWLQINASPYYISDQVNLLCAAPIRVGVEEGRRQNPHAETAITVFTNKVGYDAMVSPKSKKFPVGSMIVKKKIEPKSHRDTALLHTVMIKREPGYNLKAGDWEFAVVSGDGKQVQSRGKLANCMGCHLPQRSKDYVFRTYLRQ
jgi:hypothetical protein